MARLTNQNNELTAKMAKLNMDYDKSLQDSNIKSNKQKKKIVDLKAQSSEVENKMAQKLEGNI